jgi:hypothetical protein
MNHIYSWGVKSVLSSLGKPNRATRIRKGLLARRETHFEKEADVVEKVLREGDRLGLLECSDTRTASRVLVWSTNSLLPFSLTAWELGKRKELEERVSRIADLLLRGLAPRQVHRPNRTR